MSKAALNLLPRKEFELVLEDGTVIRGQFGTWALARFGQRKKIGLGEIMEMFTTNPSVMDMVEFVLSAIEYKERQDGKPPFMNDVKLCKWIDDYADATNTNGVLMKLFNHSAGEQIADEKKTVMQEENHQNGVTSNEHSTQLAEA